MLKKVYLTLLVMSLCITIPGCGKSGTTDSSINPEISSNPSSGPDNSNNTTETPETDAPSEKTISPETTGTPEPEQTPGKAKKTKTEIAMIAQNQQYADNNRTVRVLGLKEYKKLKAKPIQTKQEKERNFLYCFFL